MSAYNDKMNQEMLKVVCDLNRLIAEAAKVTGVTILNAITNYNMGKKLHIHGCFNNYDVLSVTGLSMDEAKALLDKKKKIKAHGFYDRDGHYIFAIKRSDFDKISELEKEIADGTLNVDDFLEEYRKNKSEQGQDRSSDDKQFDAMPESINVPFEEISEDAPELTEEDIEQGGDFEVNFNPEEVVQNIENEKAYEIENETVAEKAIDHNDDFTSEKENEYEVSESVDVLHAEEMGEDSDITPRVPPVPENNIEETSTGDQNIDAGDEHTSEATDEFSREDSNNVSEVPPVPDDDIEVHNSKRDEERVASEDLFDLKEEFSRENFDNVPSIQEEQTESEIHDKGDSPSEKAFDDLNNAAAEDSPKDKGIYVDENETDVENEVGQHDVKNSANYLSDESSLEDHRNDPTHFEESPVEKHKDDSAYFEESKKDSGEQERRDTSTRESYSEDASSHFALTENNAIDHSGENASYRNDSNSEKRANSSEQTRFFEQHTGTEQRNNDYNSTISDRQQNINVSIGQRVSSTVSMEERDRLEKEKAIQKQIDRKERRENVTVTEIGTGASLFTAYGDIKESEMAAIANKTNAPVFSDHRELNTKKEISEHTTLRDNETNERNYLQNNILPEREKGHLPEKFNSNDKALTNTKRNDYIQQRTDVLKSNTDVQFNRLTLVNRYTGNIATDMAKSTGTLIAGSVQEGHRESYQGQGKAQMSGISTFINNVGYSNYAQVKRDALLRKTQRELNNGTGEYAQLNQLLKIKGFTGMDFSSRNKADASMEDIYKLLQRSGLASNRQGSWDLTKFDRLFKQAKKHNDYASIARALGISNVSSAEMKLISKQINTLVKRDKTFRLATEGKRHTGKTLRSMIAHKLGQNSEVLAGYMNLKQTIKTTRATIKAAWLIGVTTGRVAGKLMRVGYKITRYSANTRFLRNTDFGRGFNALDAKVQSVNQKVENVKNSLKAKKDEKDTKKENKKTDKKKREKNRKENKRKNRQAAMSSLVGKWNRFAPKFIRTNSFAGRTVKKTTKFVGKTFKGVSNAVKKVIGAIGAVATISGKIKIIVIAAIGLFTLLICGSFLIVSVVAEYIPGFEFDDEENGIKDLKESIMGQALESLQNMEEKWTDSLLNDTQTIDLTDYDLKYGDSYESPSEYMPKSGAPRIFWGQHNVKWNDISGFTANPFGNFDLENDNTASFMNNIEGGVELIYKTRDGSSRTSNIKEIICMADVYTMFSTEAEDNHDDGKDIDGSESASMKRSGAIYAAFNKPIKAVEKKLPSKVLLSYSQDLFNMSHQEIIDLQYVILPTIITKDSFNPDTTVAEGEGGTTVKVTQCPDYELGGCQIYENFYYDKDGISVKDKDEVLHVAGGVYPLQDSNLEFEKDDEGNIVNYEQCYANSVDGFEKVYNESNSGCWSVENQGSSTESVKDYETPNESGFSDTVKSLTGDNEYVTGFSWDANGQYFVLTTDTVGDSENHTESNLIIDDPGGNGRPANTHIENEEYTLTDVEHTTYHVVHDCEGNHHGRYCGGHLKAKITGVIYGFTNNQVTAEDTGFEIEGKVGDDEFIHKDRSKFTVENTDVFKTAKDVFDIDAACTHPSEREDWEGWTTENMELALLKYNMDWDDLYGFDIASSLGGRALASADTKEIMDQIKANYPGLSERRLEVVETALGYVGKIGYSQAHHGCPLEGPCNHGGGEPCYLSDCSGFTSNLWINELGGIYTTVGFRSKLNGNFDSSRNLPGDILVHYDPKGNHALLYIGEFEYDGVYQTWSIDCSTVNGVGNVFLRHRNYYDSCSYVSPAP